MRTSVTSPLSVMIAGFILCLLAPSLTALQIHQYDQQRHLRFEAGSFPASPVPNQGLWVNHYNFHGVGWSPADTHKGFALISPRHFVGANHFRPPLGSQIEFFSIYGELRSYTYVKFYNLKNPNNEDIDIFIGEFSENIPASHGIPLYPVLNTSELQLIGREIIVYGRGQSGPRIGRGVIDIFGDSLFMPFLNDTRNYSFQYREINASQDDSYGETGDSGSPSFIAVEGMLTVSGTHSAIITVGPTTTTYDSFILHYKDQINDHLATTGQKLTLAPLGDTNLRITTAERAGNEIILQVENPADLPYDVHRTDDLALGDWEIIATSQTGSLWTDEIPPEADRLFWKLVRYPLPTTELTTNNPD